MCKKDRQKEGQIENQERLRQNRETLTKRHTENRDWHKKTKKSMWDRLRKRENKQDTGRENRQTKKMRWKSQGKRESLRKTEIVCKYKLIKKKNK